MAGENFELNKSTKRITYLWDVKIIKDCMVRNLIRYLMWSRMCSHTRLFTADSVSI
ncbi:hypothetical protein C5167_004254 [Papaver somniferum]|nr:hypothetical protein C5167_004254 [Papaver somniferum]